MLINGGAIHLVKNEYWPNGPNLGFLTPTVFSDEVNFPFKLLFGGVRDTLGRSVIRLARLYSDLQVVPEPKICFDRRNSGEFDTDGTILGHINQIDTTLRMYYVGFRKSSKVKFQAFSGLAESLDFGRSFTFRRRIFTKLPSILDYRSGVDIIACHWNNLEANGNGEALIAIGSGWKNIDQKQFPMYSSYFVKVENFEILEVVAKIPQSTEIYRLGRPRFFYSKEQGISLIVATGGKENGDYRPYFFEFKNGNIITREDLQMPVVPGDYLFCKKQVSYPEFVSFYDHQTDICIFNGDRMGEEGCFALPSQI
jgi:hypothetical protein